MIAIHNERCFSTCEMKCHAREDRKKYKGQRYRHGIGLVTAFCVIWLAWNNKNRQALN